jgi:hypothetical protein
MPAQSPTLSPTLSAMVAALRGSSSGMPCSTLPTRSAPTSAALVKMPPPTRMNIASSAPPKAKPSSTRGAWSSKMISTSEAPSRPRPTVNMPTTPPARKASRSAGLVPDSLAAFATRRLVRVASVMPMKPTSPENSAPTRKKIGRRPARPCRRREQEQQQEDQDREDGQGAELPRQVGRGALLDGLGDLLHLRRALAGGQHLPGEHAAKASATSEVSRMR